MAQEVRSADKADIATLGPALARAFHDDPIWTWVFDDDNSRMGRLTKMFTRFTRHGLRRGDLLFTTPDRAGLAHWRPPKRWRESRWDMVRLGLSMVAVFGSDTDKLMQLGRVVEAAHPTEPHWYLQILGTDPPKQGTGVGSAVMRPILDRCDAEGIPAYLETETAANVAFYSRHGFEVREEADVPKGGPHMWFLWREPRTG